VSVPIIYYGGEHCFSGGDDPLNRAPLWPTAFDQSGAQFHWYQVLLGWRAFAALALLPLDMLLLDESVMAFSRGANTFVALTNSVGGKPQTRTVAQSPFAPGAHICNIFAQLQDCIVTDAQSGSWQLKLDGGEVKVYVPHVHAQSFLASPHAAGIDWAVLASGMPGRAPAASAGSSVMRQHRQDKLHRIALE